MSSNNPYDWYGQYNPYGSPPNQYNQYNPYDPPPTTQTPGSYTDPQYAPMIQAPTQPSMYEYNSQQQAYQWPYPSETPYGSQPQFTQPSAIGNQLSFPGNPREIPGHNGVPERFGHTYYAGKSINSSNVPTQTYRVQGFLSTGSTRGYVFNISNEHGQILRSGVRGLKGLRTELETLSGKEAPTEPKMKTISSVVGDRPATYTLMSQGQWKVIDTNAQGQTVSVGDGEGAGRVVG